MAVYGYCRVSTDRQADQGVSLDDQQRRIGGRAQEHSWTIDEMFVDEGITGSQPFAERPAGGRLMQQLKTGDVVLVAKFDRAFRSTIDALEMIEHFQKTGVRMFALDMGGDITKPGGVGKLMVTLLAAVAKFERDLICERARNTRQHLDAAGLFPGGARQFGKAWKDEDKATAELEADALKLINIASEYGMSSRDVVTMLAKRNVRVSHVTVQRLQRRHTTAA
jgi:putative DNA-invertase from lambdoid prophage Rac